MGGGVNIFKLLFPALFHYLPAGHFRQGGHEVIRVHNRALAALHLALGEEDHAVAEVVEVFGPGVAQFVQNVEEHLEVVLLL